MRVHVEHRSLFVTTDVYPHDQPSPLRLAAFISHGFIVLVLLLVGTACKPNAGQQPAAAEASATPQATAAETASAKKAPQSQPFESISGCVLLPDKGNDADSFLIRLPNGNEEIVRLYFVDAPESETAYRDRLDEQGAYFGITRQQAAKLGKEAAAFTFKCAGGAVRGADAAAETLWLSDDGDDNDQHRR